MLLRLTDGTTTIKLHDNSSAATVGIYGARYVPTESDNDTVTETADIVFGGDQGVVLSIASDVKRILKIAENPDAPTVYIEYREIDSGDVYRSPVQSGRLVWSSDPALRHFAQSTPTIEAALIITRNNYWEGPEETIGNTTIRNGTTSPYNAISLTQIEGSLPTPVKVRMTNPNGVDMDTRNLYLAVDAFAGLTSNAHLYAGTSGSWGSATTHSTLLHILTLSATAITALAGKAIHVLGAFSTVSTGIYMRASLYSLFESVYESVNHGPEKYTTGEKLVDLGVLEVPKVVTGGLVLVITVQSDSAGTANLTFAQVAPAKGAVKLSMGYEWDASDIVTYDGPEDTAYYETGGAKHAIVRKIGGPLMVWPDRTNRLHILFDEGTDFTASRQTNVTVTARPRRATI